MIFEVQILSLMYFLPCNFRQYSKFSTGPTTDYGRPTKPFFIEIQNFWAWADKYKLCAVLGTLDQTISTHFQGSFWYSDSLVHVFHYSTIIFTKILSFYIHIPNIYLRLGFEYEPQRISDLAFMCPQFMGPTT